MDFFGSPQTADATSAEFDWAGGSGIVEANGDFNGCLGIFEAASANDPTDFECPDSELNFVQGKKVPFTLGPCKIRMRIVNSQAAPNAPAVNFSFNPV